MTNKTFKNVLLGVGAIYVLMLTVAITDDRQSVALAMACGAFVCLGLFLSVAEPKRRPPEKDPYWESSRKQAEERTKEFMVKTRRKNFKVIKGNKDEP